MSFSEAVRRCFEKYLSIEGRARRSEYWWFVLFGILGSLVAGLVDLALFGSEASIVQAIFSLAILLPNITVAVRRLHDRDMSGWWFLLNLIPLIGSLILFVIYVLPGTEGPNRFGPDPLGPDRLDDDTYTRSSIPRSGRE